MDSTKIIPVTYINATYTKETFGIDAYNAHKTLELVYVKSGKLDMTYYCKNKKNIQSISLAENQLMIIKPDVYHFQIVKDRVHMMVLELLYDNNSLSIVDFFARNEFIKMIPNASEFFYNLNPVTVITDSHNIQENFQKIIQILHNKHNNQPNEFFEVEYKLYLMRLILNIFKSVYVSNTKRYNKYTEFVYSYLQKNYSSPFSFKPLEESTNLSQRYLNSLFKKDIGQSIYSYLTTLRLNKAIELLNEQSMSISSIAKKVGFNNLRSFELAFAKMFNLSPTEYISNLKKKNVILWVDNDTRQVHSNEDTSKQV